MQERDRYLLAGADGGTARYHVCRQFLRALLLEPPQGAPPLLVLLESAETQEIKPMPSRLN